MAGLGYGTVAAATYLRWGRSCAEAAVLMASGCSVEVVEVKEWPRKGIDFTNLSVLVEAVGSSMRVEVMRERKIERCGHGAGMAQEDEEDEDNICILEKVDGKI